MIGKVVHFGFNWLSFSYKNSANKLKKKKFSQETFLVENLGYQLSNLLKDVYLFDLVSFLIFFSYFLYSFNQISEFWTLVSNFRLQCPNLDTSVP